jgi:hypothetical protein
MRYRSIRASNCESSARKYCFHEDQWGETARLSHNKSISQREAVGENSISLHLSIGTFNRSRIYQARTLLFRRKIERSQCEPKQFCLEKEHTDQYAKTAGKSKKTIQENRGDQ